MALCMTGIRVIPNSATAASESCSGIRHKLMSRCERSLVGRGASMRDAKFKRFYLPKSNHSTTGPRAKAGR